MRLTSALSSVLCFAVLLLASPARAQDGTPNQPPPGSGTPNQPPPGSGTPNQPPPDAPPPGVAPGVAPPQAAPAPIPYREGEAAEPKDEGRLRIGFNVNGGLGFGGNFGGPAAGATFRVGWQLSHLMAIYGQASVIAWVASSSETLNGKSLDAALLGGYQFTPLFSLNPIDLVELAAGPSLDNLSGGSTSNTADVKTGTFTTTDKAYTGFYFGLHGRVALHIGGKPNTTTGRRVSFTIGLDVHPTFATGGAVTFYTLGLGADWY